MTSLIFDDPPTPPGIELNKVMNEDEGEIPDSDDNKEPFLPDTNNETKTPPKIFGPKLSKEERKILRKLNPNKKIKKTFEIPIPCLEDFCGVNNINLDEIELKTAIDVKLSNAERKKHGLFFRALVIGGRKQPVLQAEEIITKRLLDLLTDQNFRDRNPNFILETEPDENVERNLPYWKDGKIRRLVLEEKNSQNHTRLQNSKNEKSLRSEIFEYHNFTPFKKCLKLKNLASGASKIF